ncbi:MAG: entericidin A/B family lipoprotein [Paracoccaceae bacterium]|nr:entericidin A/B family lipoprotein [Paracoccaceae bacterium]
MTRTLITLTALLALAACDTVAGAGKDISKAGQVISSTAKQTQAGM